MAGTLDQFFVSLGIKGQDAVLKTIDKVKKDAGNLSKVKANIDLGKGNLLKSIIGMAGGKSKSGQYVPSRETPSNPADNPEEKKKEENANNKFAKSAKIFGDATKTFASSASSLDPAAMVSGTIQGIGSALGDAFSGISVLGVSLGQLPKGIAEIGNSMFTMANSSLTMAKQVTAEQYGLSTRNATTANYGGNNISQSGMSNAEHASLVMEVAGSYGKIQKPLQGILNQLVENKDTAALGRVASGNWQSTGTDKGWMLQQISNQTQGLPPSIAQAIQSSLLRNNSEEIQDKTVGQKGAQSLNAQWVNKGEAQTAAMYETAAANNPALVKMNDSLNTLQKNLFTSGVSFASAINTATDALASLPDKIKKVNEALDSMKNKLPSGFGNYMPSGIGK